jgi:hypothetical protein
MKNSSKNDVKQVTKIESTFFDIIAIRADDQVIKVIVFV